MTDLKKIVKPLINKMIQNEILGWPPDCPLLTYEFEKPQTDFSDSISLANDPSSIHKI